MPKSPAEEYLVTEGILPRRTHTQQVVLGCIGCRWSISREFGVDPTTYAAQVSKCSGIKVGTVVPILKRFEAGGAIVSEREQFDPRSEGRPVRRYYRPADTTMGRAFAAKLEMPPSCNLDQTVAESMDPDDMQLDVPEFRSAMIRRIIDTSTREELEMTILIASEQITRLDDQS